MHLALQLLALLSGGMKLFQTTDAILAKLYEVKYSNKYVADFLAAVTKYYESSM